MSRGLPTISALDLWHESARTRPGELPENPRTKYWKKRYDFQRLEVFARLILIREPQWHARGVRCVATSARASSAAVARRPW
jgi:hypothetical protein